MSDHTPRPVEPRDRVVLREGDAAPRDPVFAPLGSMPGGFEFPPRRYPPNAQHLDIPQTYDARVSVQLERTARDLAAGKPGTAAREDAERATVDNPRGSPPPPPLPREVEGMMERETLVTFATHFLSYYPGETAAFTAEEAARLDELGVTGDAGGAAGPPVNVDIPHVAQEDATLTCTMGNWQGEPTDYAYQWQRDGTDIGAGVTPYAIVPADVGTTVTCVVTATNALGSTIAPPSNGVVVTEPAAGTTTHRRAR